MNHEPNREGHRGQANQDHDSKSPLVLLIWIDHSLFQFKPQPSRVACLQSDATAAIVKG